jgi:hypothetical protein
MKNWDLKSVTFLVVAVLAVLLAGYLSRSLAGADKQLSRINQITTILIKSHVMTESPKAVVKGISDIHSISMGLPVSTGK